MNLTSPLRHRRAAVGIVALVAGLVYANALGNGFAYDDVHIVVNNTRIHSLETLPAAVVAPYWPSDYARELGLWRPVTTALLGLQYVAGAGEPWLFHAVNVLGHVVATMLVVLLLTELLGVAAAFAAGLVFAVHPVHVEAVANVIGVSEIVSTAAVLAACLIHVRFPARSGWRSALAVGALYAIAFGAKESAVTLPGLVFLLDAARRRIGVSDLAAYLRDRWRVYAVMLGVALALLAARRAVLGSIANPLPPLGADILTEIPRIWTVAEVWTHYARLWVFPLDLASDYSPNVIPISFGWHATNSVGAVLAILVLGLTLVAWRRPAGGEDAASPRAAALGVLWFVIAISPISNTVFLSGVLLAERTLYLPSVGLAAVTGWLIAAWARTRGRAAWALLLACVVLASARTWTRSPTWLDNATMLTTLVAEAPHSGRSQWILGDAFLQRGRISEGLTSYRAAIDLLDTHYLVVTEISKQLLEIERYAAAEVLLRIAADNDPEYPLAFGLLSLIRAEHGDAAAAERYARLSLGLHDDDAARHHLLAWALAAQGRWEEARGARARAQAQGTARIWQEQAYEAYRLRESGDAAGVGAALDSAWSWVYTAPGRASLDSVIVSEFGLPSRLR